MTSPTMKWISDPATERAARRWFPIPAAHTLPSPQYAGRVFNPERSSGRIALPAQWPSGILTSAPAAIIAEFRSGHFTQALELVVAWGGMARARRHIWKYWSPTSIEAALKSCAESVIESQSIEPAWAMLTGMAPGQLGWSAVISSKTLHFLCRALGFEADPPVALDNAVIRNLVWPRFKMTFAGDDRPKNWDSKDFAAYNRYMTAIRVWATVRYWSTTELEATLFATARTST